MDPINKGLAYIDFVKTFELFIENFSNLVLHPKYGAKSGSGLEIW